MGTSKQSGELELIVSLLKRSTSLSVVAEFLKQLGVRSSGFTWDNLLTERIKPAIDSYQLKLDALYELLADVEEHGRKHVYLYTAKGDNASRYLADKHITHWASTQDIVLDANDIFDVPEEMKVCNIRKLIDRGIEQLIVRIVEKRTHFELVKSSTSSDGTINKSYSPVDARAVSVARLKANGKLEVRITPDAHTTNYKEKLASLWVFLDKLIRRSSFEETSLQKARNTLQKKKDELSKEMRFQGVEFRPDNGNVITAATGKDRADLFDGSDSAKKLEALIDANGYCGRWNLCWLKQSSGSPTGDVHVRLAGEINEFVVTGGCSKSDYNYVLTRILHYAK